MAKRAYVCCARPGTSTELRADGLADWKHKPLSVILILPFILQAMQFGGECYD